MEQEYWYCRQERLGALTGGAIMMLSLLISTLVSARFPLRQSDLLSGGPTRTPHLTGRGSTLIRMSRMRWMRFSS